MITAAAPVALQSVLIADDEDSIRDLIALWLKERGHTVVAVRNSQEASRLVRERRFDLIITDVVMPDGDGFELIAAARKIQPAARIIAMSGGGRYLQGQDCLRIARGLGAHAAMTKPFSFSQLLQEITALRPSEDPATL